MGEQFLIRLIADGAIIPIVLVGSFLLIFKVPKGHRYKAYCRILMAGLTAYLVAKLVASIYQPSLERPFELLGVQAGALFLNNPGFPSDHTLFAAAITLAVWFETKYKRIALVLGGLTVLICVGRVVALVHTPMDVIFGIVFALLGSFWYFLRPRQ
jgi:membrane-associated phospholipid phosphatase